MSQRRLLYPDSFSGTLPAVTLTADLELVHIFGTASPMGYQVPLLFTGPARVLLKIESNIGTEKNWLSAGRLAQLLYGLPGDPKYRTERLYLDEAFFILDGGGYPYYLEFWALRWLSDYFIEVWAQLPN